MGILSIKRNLLSNSISKLKSLYSSNLSCIRRILSPDPKYKTMFLIENDYKGLTNYSLLSAPAAEKNNSSWKDHHHSICNPFSGYVKHLLAGSCNELTLFFPCLMDDSKQRRFSLWNPTTNRIKTLPPSFLPRPRPVATIDTVCFGFGFEPKSQDYKFINFLEYDYEDGFDSWGQYHVEVYSLKTDSWTQITASSPLATPTRQPAVHVNGVYYWVSLGGLATFSILSFDFANENFSLIPLPEAVADLDSDTFILAEFHGSLATIVHSDLNFGWTKEETPQQPFCFEIWVWDGKSWISGSPKVTIGDARVYSVLGLFQNDYLFLQGFHKGELLLFDRKTSKVENLGIHAELKSNMLSFVPYTVPSSVLAGFFPPF